MNKVVQTFSSSITFAAKDSSSSFTTPPPPKISISTVANMELKTVDGDTVLLGNILSPSGGDNNDDRQPVILSCLSHFGDFNAWELTQSYQAIDYGGSRIILVGIGSADAARGFANDLGLDSHNSPDITLLADETGSVTDTLGCYRGWLAVDRNHAERWPSTDINPYVKLLGMIFGLGSPGTISKVLRGYVGDKNDGSFSRKWVVKALLQGGRSGRWPKLTEEAFDNDLVFSDDDDDDDAGGGLSSGLRPFELATLRAQTGIHIVSNWGRLGPKDGDLFTRMGGTFVFDEGGECVYGYYDNGILMYADVREVCEAAVGATTAPAATKPLVATTVTTTAEMLATNVDESDSMIEN